MSETLVKFSERLKAVESTDSKLAKALGDIVAVIEEKHRDAFRRTVENAAFDGLIRVSEEGGITSLKTRERFTAHHLLEVFKHFNWSPKSIRQYLTEPNRPDIQRVDKAFKMERRQ